MFIIIIIIFEGNVYYYIFIYLRVSSCLVLIHLFVAAMIDCRVRAKLHVDKTRLRNFRMGAESRGKMFSLFFILVL